MERGTRRLRADESAHGAHTSIRRDAKSGRIVAYATYRANSWNPNDWQLLKRYDGSGRPHYNKFLAKDIATPHVHEPAFRGGLRKPYPEEVPQ